MRRAWLAVVALAALAAAPARADAQGDAALVEALAPLLKAEDARSFDAGLFRRALEHADPEVRRAAALAVGRLRDPRGVALLLPVLIDRDSSVQAVALFALGLIADSASAGPVMERFATSPALSSEAAVEGITALSRIGGAAVGRFFSVILRGNPDLAGTDPVATVDAVVRESWRLGENAPSADLARFARDTSIVRRKAAIYTLGRLRVGAAGSDILLAMEDPDAIIRSWAVRPFTPAYTDSAGLAPDAVRTALTRATDDEDAGVRINALRALATWRDSALAGTVIPHLDDPDPNVRVTAAAALGRLGGSEAVAALVRAFTGSRLFALQREALVALARVDTSAFQRLEASWRQGADWRTRSTAAEAWALLGDPDRPEWKSLLTDPDPRVVAALLQAWSDREEEPGPLLARAARERLASPDAAVRSVAAGVVGRLKEKGDIAGLAAAYRRASADSFPDAALAALGGLAAIAGESPEGRQAVDDQFLLEAPRPDSYLIRRWAVDSWPDASALWGAAWPIETGRTLQDYRDLARRYLVPSSPDRMPHVFLETEQRGTLEIELFGPDAPLTVTNFLLLVDRHFFDGNRWHRVVPNFVVQDGDPRGDGWGGPGGAIRDEINRRRYESVTVGMALSGPDTGSSQWFITLSPQPHLDGNYTVFGRIVGSRAALLRVTQGDLIRTIRR